MASAGSLKVCKCGIGSCFNLDLEGENSRKHAYLLFSRNFLVTLTYAPLQEDKFAANNQMSTEQAKGKQSGKLIDLRAT